MMEIMPKWSWEVCKMFLYMTFPVAMFHYFNSPQIFEKEINKIKQENFPSISSEQRKYIETKIEEVRIQRELKDMEELKTH